MASLDCVLLKKVKEMLGSVNHKVLSAELKWIIYACSDEDTRALPS